MEIALILTTVFFLSAIIGIVWVNRDNAKLMQYHINMLENSNKELHKQLIEILDKQREETIKKAQEQEHELQGEFEADDDTYNRIVSEWIYGAEEEGGIDGEQRNTDGL